MDQFFLPREDEGYRKALSLVAKNHQKLSHNLLMPVEIRSNAIIDWVGDFTLPSLAERLAAERPALMESGFPPLFFDCFDFAIHAAKARVKSFSNLAVFLQGDFSRFGPEFKRTSMFDHFHTPRAGKLRCHSASFFFPLHGEEDAEEFHYFDLNEIGYETLPYQTPEKLVADYRSLSGQIDSWKVIPVPVKKVTELNFCSSRMFHAVRNFRNTFLVFILNDAEFFHTIDEASIHTRYHDLSPVTAGNQ